MKAIVLFSGGLDSTVILAKALHEGRECLALSFDYGQPHRIELEYGKKIIAHYGISHKMIEIDPQAFNHSTFDVQKNRTLEEISKGGVPSTYFPARNTLFLAYATGQAEILGAQEIYAGPNMMDYHPYPDCRPEYYHAFQEVINLATKQSIEGNAPKLITPLINMNKKEIFQLGKELNAPLEMSFSCYDPTPEGTPCEECDACILRNVNKP